MGRCHCAEFSFMVNIDRAYNVKNLFVLNIFNAFHKKLIYSFVLQYSH